MIQLQHYPMPDRPSNPSPLEMAIYNYELLAKNTTTINAVNLLRLRKSCKEITTTYKKNASV
ncbi:hypothetical protein PSDI105340_16475 [Pseudoalteromonas distincta]